MKTSESQAALGPALFAAKGEFPHIAKNKRGQAGNRSFNYAPLDAIQDATDPVLRKHGLMITQGTEGHELVTRLEHAASGEWRETRMPVNVEHANMQSYGIEVTYRRRYSVQLILGIVTEEDIDIKAKQKERGKDFTGNQGGERGPRLDGLEWSRVDELEQLAADMMALQSEGRELAAVKAYYELPSNEEKLVVWGFLKGPGGGSTPESRLRSAIKANPPQQKAA
jgi:hypothetical protein